MNSSHIEANSPAGVKRPQLEMVGRGKYSYLWIGHANGFYGFIDNTPALRKFIRGALRRLESKSNRKREAK